MENILPILKLIKKDAIINVKISAGLTEKLISCLTFLRKTLSPEQIDKYHEELQFIQDIYRNEKKFSEEWMYAVTTISILLNDIQREAELQGLTTEVSTEDYLKFFINKEDNQSADQSQLQPE
jgi:hypothetical protein